MTFVLLLTVFFMFEVMYLSKQTSFLTTLWGLFFILGYIGTVYCIYVNVDFFFKDVREWGVAVNPVVEKCSALFMFGASNIDFHIQTTTLLLLPCGQNVPWGLSCALSDRPSILRLKPCLSCWPKGSRRTLWIKLWRNKTVKIKKNV